MKNLLDIIFKLTLSIILFVVAVPCVAQAQKPSDPLVIAISSDFRPFTFLNADGKPAGMFVDIWRLWSQKTGNKIEFIYSDWKTSLENLQNETADIHSGLTYSPDRSEWMSNSPPFYEVGLTLFYLHKKGKISSLNELSGQTIAVVSGVVHENYIKKNYPGIRILNCKTREELVAVTNSGKARGFLAIPQVGQVLIDRMGLTGEFEAMDKMLYVDKIQPGVLKKNAELAALVANGFKLLSTQELTEIEARWIHHPEKRFFKSSPINLTAAEKAWLQQHKTIRVGMSPIFPPLKFSENGEIKGIEPDYLKLLSEYTGLQFEYVIADFSVMDAKVKNGEMDMFLSFNIPERLSYMSFTDPFMEFKQVIIARSDAPFLSGLSSLKGMKVATVKGVKLYDKLLEPYPDIEKVQVDTMEQMFRIVSEAKADVLISKTYFAGYVMKNYPNLRIAGVADLPPEPYLYAVRKDYPELVSILNKAITSVSQERRDAIVQKWFSMRIDYRPSYSEILKWIASVSGVFVFIIVFAIYWNKRLSKEIDKRMQTEESLKSALADLAEAQAISHVGSWRLIIDEEGEHWSGSDELYRIYGYPPSMQITMQTGLDRMHPDDLEHVKAAWSAAMNGVGPYEWEHRIVVDGQVKWLNVGVKFVLDRNGKPLEAAGVVYDITERKQAEEERLNLERKFFQVQKLESLGVLAGGIAHDFNNILTAIIGNAALAQMKLSPESPLVHFIQQIETAAERAADLAKQMLAYSGKGKFHVENLDINRLLEEMLHLLKISISRKVVLRLHLAPHLPTVEADATQIRQVVMNLLINASEAIGDNEGVIAVHTGCLECDRIYLDNIMPNNNLKEGKYIFLEVTDSGCGMDRETVDRIFDPFFTTKFTGRGLGMSAVQGIVRGHNGIIKVYSELNNGSTFKVLLPAFGKVAETFQTKNPEGNWQGSGTILLVDDEEIVRNICSEMLKELGFAVITANDGVEAVEIYKSRADISCVILDLTMPRMGGEQCFQELRKIDPEGKIIMSSGYSEQEVSEKFGNMGVSGFIQKPYNFNVLQQTLKSVFQ